MNIHHEFLDLLEAVPQLMKEMHGNSWGKKQKTHGGPKVKTKYGPKAGIHGWAMFFSICTPIVVSALTPPCFPPFGPHCL